MITLDGKHISEFGFMVEPGQEDPITPVFEHKTMHIPGRPGAWDFGSEIRERHFFINLRIMDRFHDNMQSAYNRLVAFLFDQYGQPKLIKVVREYEPDKYMMVKVMQQMIPVRLVDEGELRLPLVAYDPYKYASADEYDPNEDYLYNQGYEYNTGLFYDNPQSFNWLYERHYSAVHNYSNLETELLVDIRGTVQNPKITNLLTNETLTLPSINQGTLFVDGKTSTIYRNGQDTLEGSNYNFFSMQPGEVGFLFEGENPNATVTYKWLHKYM